MKADRWPLPRIEKVFNDLCGAKVVTTLDFLSGYWQIRMDYSCEEMISFTTRHGTYQFEVLPFHLVDASFTFSRMMDVVIQGLPFARVYIVNVVIFGRSMKDHASHIRELVQKLSDTGLWIKISKGEFAQYTLQFLGHVIFSDGVRADDSKLAAIEIFLTLTSPTELRSFLGLAGNYCRFIKRLADTSSVLHANTFRKAPSDWTEEMYRAFWSLKEMLTTPLSWNPATLTFLLLLKPMLLPYFWVLFKLQKRLRETSGRYTLPAELWWPPRKSILHATGKHRP